ncbi:MAG: hypothetical protein LKE37_03855 [Atopobiaceae bacterium]|nr:hypothetical protein [Atopobiaceae bacterium]
MIKSSGYRIGPFEIESVLLAHEAVRECAVTGVPDPVRGYAVKATVVLSKGFEGTDDLTKELQTWVKHKTAPYKYPRVIDYVDELPKTTSGKIRRVAIRIADEERAHLPVENDKIDGPHVGAVAPWTTPPFVSWGEEGYTLPKPRGRACRDFRRTGRVSMDAATRHTGGRQIIVSSLSPAAHVSNIAII